MLLLNQGSVNLDFSPGNQGSIIAGVRPQLTLSRDMLANRPAQEM